MMNHLLNERFMGKREVRPVAYQMTADRFPAQRDFNRFNFASANEALNRQLQSLSFLDIRATWCSSAARELARPN